MKIAVCEFNPTVGALAHNSAEIVRLYEEVARSHPEIDIVVFPEMAIPGYPVEDLALNASFVFAVHEANTTVTQHVLERDGGPALIVGSLMMAPENKRTPYGPIAHNIALIVEPGETVQVVIKQKMANYGVFDEKRTFIAADGATLDGFHEPGIRVKGRQIGVMICEDGWSERVPNYWKDGWIDCVIWINASPFEYEKRAKRREVAMAHFGKRVEGYNIRVIYANMCGGQDELVYDGDSFMLTSDNPEEWHPICTAGERFRPNQIVLFDTQVSCYPPAAIPDATPAIYRAIVLGLRDYLGKQGFSRVVIGMSGGVDSALVAALACDAIGPQNVDLLGLPSMISSSGSVIDAGLTAKALGARYMVMSIAGVVDTTTAAYGQLSDANRPNVLTGTAAENIQSRIRGLLLMAVSNQEGSILLTTGNKTEVSVGYTTIFGDMMGGFNPLKDCYKTTVWEMCRWRNSLTSDQVRFCGFSGETGEIIPARIIEKPPSAELSEGQRDDQTLPPYEVLDPILKMMIEEGLSNAEIVGRRNDEDGRPHFHALVQRIRTLVDRSEYKRRQAAPGIKITSKLHGRDRRVPIVNHWHG